MWSIYYLHNWNAQVDYDKDIDIVMPMYNLIEYSHAYSKIPWRL